MSASYCSFNKDALKSPRTPREAWFAVQSKPNAVNITARNLRRQGFCAFLPVERYTLRRGGSLMTATRPYFSGYLFVRFDADTAPWRAIRSTYGVSRLVCFGARPAEVDPELVSALIDACDEDGVVRPKFDAQPGDTLKIAEGPLAGLMGTLEAMAPQERAWVLLDVMGQSTRVCLPTSGLRRAV